MTVNIKLFFLWTTFLLSGHPSTPFQRQKTCVSATGQRVLLIAAKSSYEEFHGRKFLLVDLCKIERNFDVVPTLRFSPVSVLNVS
ncbi:hypothetical protein Y032_0023g685 [Ancylostoma ceylanicum]|uniref:Secreted protein n=1 Tax=Ancylostoma ceylanicum TaxID=53326 RepID=A0A016UY77_9BILA|nr:hypothetical protein Y032_0023g685 [Ancylostoma ceylanicum]